MASDYLTVLLPVSFVALFSAAVPLIIVFAPIVLFSQFRASSWKLANTFKRPLPIRANSIGLWDRALVMIVYLSAFNNIGLVLAYCSAFAALSLKTRLLYFFVCQNVFVALKVLFDHLVPDMPSETARERKRQEI